jgi:hypothetical protein
MPVSLDNFASPNMPAAGVKTVVAKNFALTGVPAVQASSARDPRDG